MNKVIIMVWIGSLIAVCIGSVSPNLAPPGVYHLDKVAHFFGYFVVSFLPSLLLKKMWQQAALCVGMIVFSAGLEVAQTYIPGREGSIDDLFANALGVLSGVVLSLNMSHKKRRRHRKRHKAKS